MNKVHALQDCFCEIDPQIDLLSEIPSTSKNFQPHCCQVCTLDRTLHEQFKHNVGDHDTRKQ